MGWCLSIALSTVNGEESSEQSWKDAVYFSDKLLKLQILPATSISAESDYILHIQSTARKLSLSRFVKSSYIIRFPIYPERPSHPHMCATTH